MCVTLRRLLAAAALVGLAAPAPAAPVPATGDKAADQLGIARKVLDEVGDFTYQNRSLNDVLADLKDRSKLAITLDPAVFQVGLDPNQPTVNVALKGVKLKDGLKAVLAPYNLRFGLVREGLFVSTEDGLTARQLRQRVSVDCAGTPFATAAAQLAADTGANVVVDPRLKDKATAAVTLKLDDVPLETAVRLLAEVADLRAVRMSNVLFVTTPERAEKLRPDADGPVPASPASPVFPIGPPPPAVAVPGGFGGAVPLPAQAVPPVQVEVVPAKPEK